MQMKNMKRDTQIKELEDKNSQQSATIRDMSDQMINNTHFEEGIVWCGHASSFSDGLVTLNTEDGHSHGFKTKNIPVTFTKEYSAAPMVYIVMLDAQWHHNYHAWVRVDAMDVTNEGFTARCALYNAADRYIDFLRYRWLSLPKQ